jgi:hypothetical protein
MPQKSFRAAAAAATFLLGLAAVWLSGALAPLETGLADWLVPDSEEVSVPAAPLVSREESDTAEVYSVVVREMFGGERAGGRVVLATETGVHRTCMSEGDARGLEVSAETLSDYCRSNKVSKRIMPLPGLTAPQVFLAEEDYEAIFSDRNLDGWRTFHRRYPNSSGYIYLSSVGFNEAGDEAFLYASKTCGGLCGDGWHVVLRKGPGGWRIQDKEMLWVS